MGVRQERLHLQSPEGGRMHRAGAQPASATRESRKGEGRQRRRSPRACEKEEGQEEEVEDGGVGRCRDATGALLDGRIDVTELSPFILPTSGVLRLRGGLIPRPLSACMKLIIRP